MTHKADFKQPYDYSKDLKTLVMMTNRLENYVRGTEIYGNEGMFTSGFPAVTIGGILLRTRRLNALREFIGKSKQSTLDASIAKHDAIYEEWKVHYETKIVDEAKSRIERIDQFIQEVLENPESSTNAFEPEQMRRTILQEILHMIHRSNIQDDTLTQTLASVDANLQEIIVPSAFQWHPTLETVYSSDEFWWLYREFNTDTVRDRD